MKRHTLVSAILNIGLVIVAFVAWIQHVGGAFSLLDIASLLGVIAFSLMFVHYAADALAPKDTTDKDIQYIVSRIVVLIAILAHPLLVNVYLATNGYGLPPESYEKLVGSVVPVLLGWTALAAFISFELRGKLQRFRSYIFHANILAMFLILMHGFLIGMIVMNSWFIWVWWIMLVSFTGFALKSYHSYYQGSDRYYVAMIVVICMALLVNWIGYQQTSQREITSHSHMNSGISSQQSSSNELQSTSVTRAALAANNGKEGNPCWIAIDGAVYDASNSPQWVNGEHVPSEGKARCGNDLSMVISQSPHGREVLSSLTRVGVLTD